jgi:hypothetical protein
MQSCDFIVVSKNRFDLIGRQIEAALVEISGGKISTARVGDQVVILSSKASELPQGGDEPWTFVHYSSGSQLELKIESLQDQLVVSSPHFSLRNIFCAETDSEELIVSSRPDLIAALLGRTIDPMMVMEQLLMSYLLDDHSLFSGVKRLLMGEKIIFSKESGCKFLRDTSLPYIDPTKVFSDEKSWIEKVALLTAETFSNGGAIELTGGVDSRLVLALGLHGGRKPALAFTLGPEESDDAHIAAQVSREMRIPHHQIPFDFENSDLVADGLVFSAAAGFGNIDATAYSALPGCFRKLSELRDIQVGGLGGECAMGFFYTPFDFLVPVGPFRKLWIEKRLFKRGDTSNGLFPMEVWQANYDRVYDLADCLFGETPGCWRRKTNGFYLHQRMRQWAGSVLTASLNWYQPVHPLFQAEHINWAASLPEKYRWSRQQQMQCIIRLDKELGLLPFDGGRKYAVNSIETFAQTLNKVAGVVRKTAKKLQHKPTRILGHGPKTAAILARDGRVQKSLQNLFSSWDMNIDEDRLQVFLNHPEQHATDLGTLITASWANDSLERIKQMLVKG